MKIDHSTIYIFSLASMYVGLFAQAIGVVAGKGYLYYLISLRNIWRCKTNEDEKKYNLPKNEVKTNGLVIIKDEKITCTNKYRDDPYTVNANRSCTGGTKQNGLIQIIHAMSDGFAIEERSNELFWSQIGKQEIVNTSRDGINHTLNKPKKTDYKNLDSGTYYSVSKLINKIDPILIHKI